MSVLAYRKGRQPKLPYPVTLPLPPSKTKLIRRATICGKISCYSKVIQYDFALF